MAEACNTTNKNLLTGPGGAVSDMLDLAAPAQDVMADPLPSGAGNYGPDFRLVPVPPSSPPATFGAAGRAALTAMNAVGAVAAADYTRIKAILDKTVQYSTFGALGPIWRGLTRDEFVAKVVLGRALIAVRADARRLLDRLGRATLLGLINDGLFRGRFHIAGLSADLVGKVVARQLVEQLPGDHVAGALAERYRDSGL